jgi:hypothetical protein
MDLPAYCLPASARVEKRLVADDPAQHMEHHGALLKHNRLILGRVFVQLRGLADGRSVFVRERADLRVLHHVFKGGLTLGILHVES